MSRIRTYIDSGVLIAAARGIPEVAQRANQILGDANREFGASQFLKLEVLPKAIYNNFPLEAEFYETFFKEVAHWAESDETLVNDAYQRARTYGLAALDALHVAAAIAINADELVTTEKTSKPFHRVKEIRIISINP